MIFSDQRFAYEEAQYIIETKNNTIPIETSITGKSYVVQDDIIAATLKLDELAKQVADFDLYNFQSNYSYSCLVYSGCFVVHNLNTGAP